VAAGLVWTIGHNGMLYGLSPATGQVRQQAPIGVLANHFPTPSVADSLLLAASADHVVAFTASARASTTKPAPTPSPVPASHASTRSAAAAGGGGGLPASAIVGIVVAGLVVIGGMGWLVWRRRTTGAG
jgi:hypothetical protein